MSEAFWYFGYHLYTLHLYMAKQDSPTGAKPFFFS